MSMNIDLGEDLVLADTVSNFNVVATVYTSAVRDESEVIARLGFKSLAKAYCRTSAVRDCTVIVRKPRLLCGAWITGEYVLTPDGEEWCDYINDEVVA